MQQSNAKYTNTNFKIINLLYAQISPWSLPCMLCLQLCLHSAPPCMSHILSHPHSPSHAHYNNIWWRLQLFPPSDPNIVILLIILFSNILHLFSSLRVKKSVSNPCNTLGHQFNCYCHSQIMNSATFSCVTFNHLYIMIIIRHICCKRYFLSQQKLTQNLHAEMRQYIT